MRTSAFPRHTKSRKSPSYMRPFIRDIEDKQVSTHCPPDDPPLIEIGYFPFYADELLCFFYFSSIILHTFLFKYYSIRHLCFFFYFIFSITCENNITHIVLITLYHLS